MEVIEAMCSRLSIESNITWEVIPEHIIQVIFSKLSIVNLPTCRLVCRAWNHLVLDYASQYSKFIPSTFFVLRSYIIESSLTTLGLKPGGNPRMHCLDFDGKYSHVRFDPRCFEILRISNSCNGLLCVIDGMNYSAGILNPMTNEYIKLPECQDASEDDFYESSYFYGLGFSLKTMHYKVVRVSRFCRERPDSIYLDEGTFVEIFTLGKSSQWTYLEFLPVFIDRDAIYFNGGLYWIGFDNKLKDFVCCFHVDEENFEIISLPKVDSSMRYYSTGVGVFNGHLYTTFWAGGLKFEVWTMQSYETGQNPWTKEFVISDCISRYVELKQIVKFPCWDHPQLIKVCENGEILFLFDRLYFFSYNPKTGKIKALLEDEEPETTFSIYQIESLNFDSLEKIMVGG